VRGIEARYHNASALKATFLQRRSEGKRAAEIESGTVYFRKPGRMRWEYESPETKLFVTDGKSAWFFVPADHTVSRAKMKESGDQRIPLALLTGQAKMSRVCKRVELADAPLLAVGNTALRCLPRTAGSFLDALVEVDAQFRIARITVREPGQIETEFRFSNWEQNPPLADAMFRFQAPPGVAIVEEPSFESPNP
jgi:outer membrane lipoprotein carrier protein